jgi:MFS superfamily sulfate permease-like transporter
VRRVVVAAEPITSVDVTAADTLGELRQALERKGVELCFAELKDPVKDKIRRFGLLEQFGEETFFGTIDAAVDSYVNNHGVVWEG